MIAGRRHKSGGPSRGRFLAARGESADAAVSAFFLVDHPTSAMMATAAGVSAARMASTAKAVATTSTEAMSAATKAASTTAKGTVASTTAEAASPAVPR